jgi:hypothetical protein
MNKGMVQFVKISKYFFYCSTRPAETAADEGFQQTIFFQRIFKKILGAIKIFADPFTSPHRFLKPVRALQQFSTAL